MHHAPARRSTWPLLFLLASAAAAGCGRPDRARGVDTADNAHFFREKVDCAGLPPLPSELVDAPSLSETLLADLSAGTARVALRWKDANGEFLLLTAETGAEVMYVDGTTWAVGVDLPCDPDAATFVHFPTGLPPSGGLPVGEWPISGFGFDAPRLEQGGGANNRWIDGTLTVTSAADSKASGYMSGYAGTTLMSYITEKQLEIEVEVTALAFRDVVVWE